MKPSRIFVAIMALVALAILGVAQQQKDGKDSKAKEDSAKSKQKDEPSVFGTTKLRLTGGSKASKETTTAAFNGIDPVTGKVDPAMLAKVPAATDQENVRLMAMNRPTPDDLKAFLKEGGLKQK